MTKLNHARPIFRYLDNLRREMRNAPAGAVPDDYGGEPITVVTRTGKPRKALMPRLTNTEAEIAFGMLEALSAYIDSDLAVIQTFPKLKAKGKGNTAMAMAARDVAEEALVKACAQFLIQGMQSKQQGREHLINWYGWLHDVFEEQGETGLCSAWETLNEWAMKSASEQVEKFIDHTLNSSALSPTGR